MVDPGRSLVGGVDHAWTASSSTAPSTAAPWRRPASRAGSALVQNGFVRSYALSMLVGALLSCSPSWR